MRKILSRYSSERQEKSGRKILRKASFRGGKLTATYSEII
jgi:hypothetical protein